MPAPRKGSAMNGFFQGILDFFEKTFGAINANVLFAVGLVVSVVMTAVFLGEVFNRQVVLRAPYLVKVERRWNTKSVAVMAMTAALSVILQLLGSIIVLVPGTLTLRADAMVRFTFGGIFGMPAVWGIGISNIFGDAFAGTLGPGSIAGFVISWFQAYLSYRMFNALSSYMNQARYVAKYYLMVIIWCLIGSLYLCTNFQYLQLLPTDIIWPVVFPLVMVSTFIGALLGPVVAAAVAPAARRYGLSEDRLGFEKKKTAVGEGSTASAGDRR
jgi:hypothetical protein